MNRMVQLSTRCILIEKTHQIMFFEVSDIWIPSWKSLCYEWQRKGVISSAWWKTVPSQNPVGEGTNSEVSWRRYQLASKSFLFNFMKSNKVKKTIFFILWDIFFIWITGLYILCIFYSLIIILRFVLKPEKLIEKTRFLSWYLLQPASELVPSPTEFWDGTVFHQADDLLI